jgi:RNA polymerase sigma factor (sigma-70 family)
MSAAGIAAVNTVVATDTDLVTAVRTGDDAAFEELYRRYYPRIAAFVRGYLRDGGRAEDVTQEAFMSALRRLRQTDSDITFKPWIFEIARNAAIDQYRRNVRADEVSIDIEGGFAPSDVSRVVRPRGPDSSVLDKERLDHLRGALDELSDTHHRIIVMRELEGLSYREIGEKMELTPAAVESTLFRARRKLEHEYSQLDTGRRCQLIGAVIARLAEGMESDRDRRRLDRHARRCSTCRRRSRELGVEPILPRISIAAKAAAFLPIPAFARRRFGGETAGGAAQNAAAPIGAVGAPTLEVGAAVAGKAAAVVAAVALVGGGGATLGGVGPLDLGGNGRPVLEKQRVEPAPAKKSSPSLKPDGFRREGAAGKDAGGGALERLGEAAATKQPAASPKPKEPEPQGGLRDLTPGLLPVPRDDAPEADAPPVEEPESRGPTIDIPNLEPGASAPEPPPPPSVDDVVSALGLE